MNLAVWARFFRRRSVLIAAALIVVVASGAALGFHLAARPSPLPSTATRNLGPAPTVAPIGTKAVAPPKQAVFLAVIRTTPAAGSVDNAVDTPITLDFNLPVDKSTVGSFLNVSATGSVNPSVDGTLSPGSGPAEVVFRPSQVLGTNETVSVTVRSGLNSLDGSPLATEFNFSFATEPRPQSISFMSGAEQVRLVSGASGGSITLSIQSGARVPATVALTTYRATAQDLLAAFVYSNGSYLDRPVNTATLTSVDSGGTSMTASGARTSAVQNNVQVTVSQPDGLYVIVAADAAGQYGAVWVDFSRYALLVRQDDQRVVVAGVDLATGATTDKFAVTFYNLLDGVHALASGSFTGTAEFPAKYPAGFDIAVAEAAGQTVIAPMSAPETNGDIRVVTDLSQQPKIFFVTDRLAYAKGDTVRFAGSVRLSNDEVYTLGSGVQVAVWSWTVTGKLAMVTAAADGTFSGSFVIPAAAFNSDGTDATLTLFASAPSAVAGNAYLAAATTVVAAGSHAPASSLTLTLDKPSYVASDTMVASISGVNGAGQPLAGQQVNVNVYANQHVAQPAELDSFPTVSTWGEAVVQGVPVRLDASGHASYSIKANVAHKATDEEITVEVTYGTGAAQGVSARTAIVYQAADEVYLLPARSGYGPDETVVAPFVVESRDGARVANASLAYEIDSTEYSGNSAITTVIASGTVTSDTNGLGVVRTAISTRNGSLTLRVKGKDAAGNVFEDDASLYVVPPHSVALSGDGNPRLDVLADKIAYVTGQTARLTVTSPADETVLLSLERGRVHQYRMVQLAKGDNTVTVAITPDLSPGFNVVFSYIRGGDYTSQGYPVHVNNASRVLKVTMTADQPTYTKGQTAHVTIAVSDASGAAVAASALADGYDARMSAFKLVDQASIPGAFLTPDRLTTNGSSSLLGIGMWGGMCGGGYFGGSADPTYPGHSVLWVPDLAIDASGRATVDVPLTAGPVRVVVFAGTAQAAWGQAQIDLNVQ